MRCAVAALLALLVAGAGAQAGDLSWTMRLNLDHAGVSTANEEAGRQVGAMDISGIGDVGGETADVRVLVLFDYTRGTGPWQIYMTLAFADGSVLTAYGTGFTKADKNAENSRFEGQLLVVDGTGRYAGATGSGAMRGQRAEVVGDDVQIDYEVTLNVDS